MTCHCVCWYWIVLEVCHCVSHFTYVHYFQVIMSNKRFKVFRAQISPSGLVCKHCVIVLSKRTSKISAKQKPCLFFARLIISRLSKFTWFITVIFNGSKWESNKNKMNVLRSWSQWERKPSNVEIFLWKLSISLSINSNCENFCVSNFEHT